MPESAGPPPSTLRMWPIIRAITLTTVAGVLLVAMLALVALWYANFPALQRTGIITLDNLFDLFKLVFAVVAGTGGVVALTVAYRRQRVAEHANQLAEHASVLSHEDSRRDGLRLLHERFAKAAEQLGSDKAAVRMAGVYALAGLADDWDGGRQTCVDVLCGYLRMPPGGLDEREVRDTITCVIRDHLRPGSSLVSWQGLDFDFSGADFSSGTFAEAHFSGGLVSFDGASLSGTISFRNARFSGARVSFTGTTFPAGAVAFDKARFTGGHVSFRNARFAGARVSFTDCRVSGGRLSFSDARFAAGDVSFHGWQLTESLVSFGGAQFTGAGVSFEHGELSGGELTFLGVKIMEGRVSFGGSRFSGTRVVFDHAKCTGGWLSFSSAELSAGEVAFPGCALDGTRVAFGGAIIRNGHLSFDTAVLTGGELGFGDTQFRGGTTSFAGARLDGAGVYFFYARFEGGTVDLSTIASYSIPAHFDDPVAGHSPGLKLPIMERS